MVAPQRGRNSAAAGCRAAACCACFVTGHEFTRAEDCDKESRGFSPCRICVMESPSAKTTGTIPGTVKLLLPPRQSRGFSLESITQDGVRRGGRNPGKAGKSPSQPRRGGTILSRAIHRLIVLTAPSPTTYSLFPVPYSLFYRYFRNTPSTRPWIATCPAGT